MEPGPNSMLEHRMAEGLEEIHPSDGGANPTQKKAGQAIAPNQPQGPALNWLFVDLNSYFASVEQEVRPELRGRPVGVVPMMADTTVCIAASYEAKAHGVKTGTVVADAKKMCPEIVLVEGRHEIYTDYHRRIVEAVESCLPVTAVLSIDEMACRLMGRERPLLAAMELGRNVKARILERVGPMLRSSVGLATNRYLAKVASDMEKPDGLVALPLDILPEALGSSRCATCPASAQRPRSGSTRRASPR
jgi:DNA polymerase-4